MGSLPVAGTASVLTGKVVGSLFFVYGPPGGPIMFQISAILVLKGLVGGQIMTALAGFIVDGVGDTGSLILQVLAIHDLLVISMGSLPVAGTASVLTGKVVGACLFIDRPGLHPDVTERRIGIEECAILFRGDCSANTTGQIVYRGLGTGSGLLQSLVRLHFLHETVILQGQHGSSLISTAFVAADQLDRALHRTGGKLDLHILIIPVMAESGVALIQNRAAILTALGGKGQFRMIGYGEGQLVRRGMGNGRGADMGAIQILVGTGSVMAQVGIGVLMPGMRKQLLLYEYVVASLTSAVSTLGPTVRGTGFRNGRINNT